MQNDLSKISKLIGSTLKECEKRQFLHDNLIEAATRLQNYPNLSSICEKLPQAIKYRKAIDHHTEYTL